MINILIPILGEGLRFVHEGYRFPKPMIRSCGNELLYKLIKSLNLSNQEEIYIVYREDFDNYNFKDTIIHKLSYYDKLNFISHGTNTRGATETALIGCNSIDNDNPILILDCDTIYNCDILDKIKNSKNGIVYTKNDDNKPIYSYIIYDDKNKVISIEEKIKISNNISVGAYLFENKSCIKKYAKLALENNDKECYVSGMYKEMIKNNEVIDAIYIDSFNCFGTPEQLKKMSSNIHCHLKDKKRFCFDLDNTIVSYPTIKGDYNTVKPIQKNINLLRYLYNTGHYIIIYTARRMKTHNGDVNKVKEDIEKITLETLRKFSIPYHEIQFGKPYADFYIDDLGINAFDDIEKQTGFYMLHTEPRVTNKLIVCDNTVEKFSNDIYAEHYYYSNIPKQIQYLYPKIIEYKSSSIVIEKINGIPLSYMYISNNFQENLLKTLFININKIHSIKPSNNFDHNSIYSNYVDKLLNRIKDFDFSEYKDFDKILDSIIDSLKKYQKQQLGITGIIHGDPVFSNILIDYENNFKFIDMRGRLGNELSIFGDIMYDYAKIYQSIIGYDFILYDKQIERTVLQKYKEIFQQHIIHEYGDEYLDYVINITKSLIISLIPIHNNDKCTQYFKLINNC